MNARDMGFKILLVSQFTLHAIIKSNRPDFHASMEPGTAKALFESFVSRVKTEHSLPADNIDMVEAGTFGANMQVSLINDGPVTIQIDSQEIGFKRKVQRKKGKKAGAAAAEKP